MNNKNKSTSIRTIRSYVVRSGRLTESQQKALDTHWPQFGLEIKNEPINLDEIFTRTNSKVLEIGFGNGDSLLEMAESSPQKDFIGIEVHQPGVGRLLNNIAKKQLTNVRIFCADAITVLEQCIANCSLAGVQLFFPDPWHKKKHHKRRIINSEFITLISKKLIPGGYIHLATDWENYAQQMMHVLQQSAEFENKESLNGFMPRPGYRPLTKFEQRGHRLGHGVWDLIFIRKPNSE